MIPDTLVDLFFAATCDTVYIWVKNTIEFQSVLQYMVDDLDHILHPVGMLNRRERIVIFFKLDRQEFINQIKCKMYNKLTHRCIKNQTICMVFRELDQQ